MTELTGNQQQARTPGPAFLISSAVLLQLVASLCYPIAKFGLAEIEPFTFAFYRYLIASAFLLTVTRLQKQEKPIERKDWLLDSVDAVQQAQERGIDELVSRDFSLSSARLQRYPNTCLGESVVWLVRSVDMLTGDSITVVVDAATGDQVETRRVMSEDVAGNGLSEDTP